MTHAFQYNLLLRRTLAQNGVARRAISTIADPTAWSLPSAVKVNLSDRAFGKAVSATFAAPGGDQGGERQE
jgi:hypothetical protein